MAEKRPENTIVAPPRKPAPTGMAKPVVGKSGAAPRRVSAANATPVPSVSPSVNFNEEFKRDFIKDGFSKVSHTVGRFEKGFDRIRTALLQGQAQWSQLKKDSLKVYLTPEEQKQETETYTPPAEKPQPQWNLGVARTEDPLKALRASYLSPENLMQEPVYFPKPLEEVLRQQEKAPKALRLLSQPYRDPDNYALYKTELEQAATERQEAKRQHLELLKTKDDERRNKIPRQRLEVRKTHWQGQGFSILNEQKDYIVLEKRHSWAEKKASLKDLPKSKRLAITPLAFLFCKLHPFTRIALKVEHSRFKERQVDNVNIILMKHVLVQCLAVTCLVLFATNQIPQNIWRYVQRADAAMQTWYAGARYTVIANWPRPQALPIEYTYKQTERFAGTGGEKGTPGGVKIRMVAGINDDLSPDVFALVAKELLEKYQKQYQALEIALYYKRHLDQSVPYYVLQWGGKYAKDEPLIKENPWTADFYDSFKR